MTAASPARVTAAGWGWRYAGRRLPAVSDVSFTIEPGERVLLLGASGAGKSTLLAGLAGVLGDADEGERTGSLLIDGAAPESQRGRTGLVLQDPDAGIILSKVGDDVAFGCENLGVPASDIPHRVAEAMEAVGLDVPPRRPTKALSGGQKQRLVLAGVLAMRPGLLLLDEPTANLDPDGVAEVRASVERVVESTGATLVVVEHRTPVWVDLMSRVIVLAADGGLLADGSPAQVFAEHGRTLADAGVWVPDQDVELPMLPMADAVDASAPILSAESLAISRDRRTAVQSGLDVTVPRGAATVITGPNGIGKSTLALTLAGLIPEQAGEVVSAPSLAGKNGRRPFRWASRELLTRIGTVFQEPEHQFLAQTLRDELAIGPKALGWDDARTEAVVDGLLERLGLSALALANPFTLSGGQKRRLSVATVLAASPEVIVLDEPTFGQDRRGWISLVALLQEEIARGRSVVAVTHDAGVVEHLGGHRIALAQVDAA
ncbi:Duplicated ATPase component YkoD of energizing module of thiamin-regulated ECF transporter for HydroxyMethylPyrimidine [Microbacterium esteraromaticum]|uniref:Duplicated ATPase component YkoD of energizing module of thiamin-regulated ECF transporter for HydroxyMethylPyrimidine n=1 Tax=Microbacterium esteraromaticum TaxID=57043 RepID=A0A1R4K5T2_9MICO|nr:ATP-binding cassette domain-containing protein [Microbacterium esteraromaticum]SJN39629.1 Duplicated ATPase component YkoD of energizing module of thiamin-regulated ECF transporter for HydroxyMethylPyrimidine [Microbacterium esteraromaticum]